jgi:hypothetical protein
VSRPRRLGSSVCAGLVLACGASAAASAPSPVDSILARCPTAAEVAQTKADVQIAFEFEPTPGVLVCHASAGSADLTRLQERVYQTLTIMRNLRFSRPLPWTGQTLYDWFRTTVRGVRIIDPATLPGGNGSCCTPPGVISVVGAPAGRVLDENRWIDPLHTGHTSAPWYLLETMVHEARHVTFGPHDCGIKDKDYAELGAWGVEYYFRIWLALYSGHFLDAPDPYASVYRDVEFNFNFDVICAAQADVGLLVRDSPDPVRPGGVLTYTMRVIDNGPGAVPNAFLYSLIPRGTRLLRAVPGQGTCTPVSTAPGSSVGCDLGPLAPGAWTMVRFTFRVTAKAGTTITNRPVNGRRPLSLTIGTAVNGAARDPTGFYTNARLVTTKVVAKKH